MHWAQADSDSNPCHVIRQQQASDPSELQCSHARRRGNDHYLFHMIVMSIFGAHTQHTVNSKQILTHIITI